MPDQDQLVPLSVITVDFVMDLDDKGARRVDDLQPAPFGLFPDRFGDAVRAEDHGLAVRHFAQLLNEHRPFQLERVDDVAAVDDLMPDVDGRAVSLERQLYDVDGDRKSTRLNSSHSQISYAVFCLKKKKRRKDQNAY